MDKVVIPVFMSLLMGVVCSSEIAMPKLPALSEMVNVDTRSAFKTVGDLSSFLNDLKSSANLLMAKSFSELIRRHRRAENVESFDISGSSIFTVEGVNPFGSSFQIFSHAVISGGNKTYMIYCSTRDGIQRVIDFSEPNQELKVLSEFSLIPDSSDEIDMVTGLVYGSWLWLALGSSSYSMVNIVQVQVNTGQSILAQSIDLHGGLGALHMFVAAGQLYLVLGTIPDEESISPKRSPGLYVLVDDYFDVLDGLPLNTENVWDIASFADGTNIYIILVDKYEEGSRVYRFDRDMHTLELQQELVDENTYKVVYFLDQYDNKKYIITLNSDGTSKIYWWEREQFSLWQALTSEIPILDSSLGVLTVADVEIIFFISHKDKVIFYMDDQTAHYHPVFTLETACSYVRDVHGIVVNENVFISYACTSLNGSSVDYKLNTLDIRPRTAKPKTYPLSTCLDNVRSRLKSREKNIEAAEELIPNLMTASSPQDWSASVRFPQGLSVTGTTEFVGNLTLKDHDKVHQELESLTAELQHFESNVKNFSQHLDDVLYYNLDQNITGYIDSPSLTVDKVEMGSMQIARVNDIPISDLSKEYLMSNVNQRIDYGLNIHDLEVQTITTNSGSESSKLNGVLTSDFMRRSISNQTVTGNHVFQTVVCKNILNSEDLYSAITVNNVETSDILTLGPVAFGEHGNLKSLEIQGPLDADFINKGDIRRIDGEAIYTDTRLEQILSGNYAIETVHIQGNLDVDLINNIDLKDLDRNVVKKTGDFRLEGSVVYKGNLIVNGDLIVDEVNDILWSDVMTLNPQGTLFGRYHIQSVVVSEALICDDINGIDLDKEAVLTDKTQVIKGHVGFADDVIVTGREGVLMSDGALINGIDISEINKDMRNQMGTLYVKEDTNFSRPLSVLSDVVATSVNGMLVEGLEDSFWLRSVPQDIYVSLHADEAIFSDAVVGDSINGNAFLDYLNTHEAQNISGFYDFKDHVNVMGNLDVSDGHAIDGIDVSEMASNVVTLEGQQTIHGYTKFLGKVVVDGDLEVESYLNGMDVQDDVLLLNHPQSIDSHLRFLGQTRITNVQSGSHLSVHTLNGMDVNTTSEEIVTQDSNTTIKSLVIFAGEIYVRDLVTNEKIDGIDMEAVLLEAVKKSSEKIQYVTAPVVVSGDLHFDEAVLFQVNEKDWSSHINDVVLKNYDGRISGAKIITQPMTVQVNFRSKKINNSPVRDMDLLLQKSTNQTVSGYYSFSKSISAEAILSPDIGGVDVNELLLIDDTIGLLSEVTFEEDVTFLNGISSPSDIVNECNITELYELSQLIDLNIDREFYSPLSNHHLHITGNITLNGDLFIQSENKVQLWPFLQSLLSKSSEDEISGKVIFMDDIKIDNLDVDAVGEIEITSLLQGSVRDDKDIELSCHVDLPKTIRVNRLTVLNTTQSSDNRGILVNGIDMSNNLAHASRKTSGVVVVSGNVTFTKGMVADAITITGVIDETRVSDFVAFSEVDKIANVVFVSPINISGNLEVSGLVDGVDLETALGDRITLNADQIVNGNFVFENIIVEGDLEVAVINGVQVENIVVSYGRNSQAITGQKTFNQLYINGSIEAPVINGIEVNTLQQTIIRRDQDVTFSNPVIFEKRVNAALLMDAQNLGTNMNIEEQVQTLTSARSKFTHQNENIQQLFSSVHLLNSENYAYVQSMFSELAYLERIYSQDIKKFGELNFVRYPDSYLSIRSCSAAHCFGAALTSFHKVSDNGEISLLPTIEIPGFRFILSHPSDNLYIAIDIRSDNDSIDGKQLTSEVSAWHHPGDDHPITKEIKTLGVVVDAGLFVDRQQTFIVTVSAVNDFGEPSGKAVITTLKFDIFTKQFLTAWTVITQNSASSLDLTWVDEQLFLLISNDHQTYFKTDPYTAASQLYVWHSTKQEFKLVDEFVGDHVTSGLFMKSSWPGEECFFSLTQLKAADHVIFEENVHYTKEVLIYRYSKSRGIFEEFEFIHAYGIVDQATFTIDNTLYLLLLSEIKEVLYVFGYIPLEGFHLYEEITINGGKSLEVIHLQHDSKIVVVSTRSLEGLITLNVKTKGVDPDELTFY